MKIKAADLHRLLYNGCLFTDKKSATGGVAAFVLGGTRLAVMATDDHVAITDYITVEPQETELVFFLSLESMKRQEKDLRDRAGDLEIDVDTVSTRLGTATGCYVPFADPGDPGLWNMVGQMLSLSDFGGVAGDVAESEGVLFALNPDRLRKFSLLKPGDFPVDMRYGYDIAIERDVVAFRAGPTLRGVLAPLDRELLREKYGEQAGSVLW